ncbi:MAG: hypothetical protein AAFQ45_07365 [Pseudomonadota bacterium]
MPQVHQLRRATSADLKYAARRFSGDLTWTSFGPADACDTPFDAAPHTQQSSN